MDITPEQQLIATCLSNPDHIRAVQDIVVEADFYDHRYGAAFDLIVKAYTARNPLTLADFDLTANQAGIRGIEAGAVWTWLQYTTDTATTASRFARSIHDKAMQRRLQAIVSDNVQPHGNVGERISKIITELKALRESSTDGLLAGKTLGELLDGDDEYQWVIEGLMEIGDRLIVTGGEGAGKTTFVRQLAVMCAAGIHPFKLTPIPPLRVLVIDAENTEKQWRRSVRETTRLCVQHGEANPRDTMHVVCSKRLDVTRESHIGAIHRKIDQWEPDIVFIGPIYKLTSKAIQTDDEAAPVLAALDSIRDRGLAMVIEAHAAKGNSDGHRNLAPRGSAALMGWPEFGIGLKATDKSDQYTRVVELTRWRGDRDERDWPVELTSAGPFSWNDAETDPHIRTKYYR